MSVLFSFHKFPQQLLITLVSIMALAACGASPDSTKTNPSPPISGNTATPSESSHGGHGGHKININTAILSELDKLEAKLGVPALSNKIQSSRPYSSIEDLVKNNVISQAQFDQIKDMVTIEDVVLTGEAKDVDYMLKLALMQGHLRVAGELLDSPQPEQAEPHIGHPVEEIYVDVEDQLKERNVPEFKNSLISLQDVIKANAKDAKAKTSLEENRNIIEAAIAKLPDQQRQSPEFILKVINGLLDTAATEYTAAIADGKIAAVIEYQDSRGFVLYANQLYKNIATQVEQKNPEAAKAIAASMTELMKTWPSAIAPTTPVMPSSAVSQLVKTIETTTQKIQ